MDEGVVLGDQTPRTATFVAADKRAQLSIVVRPHGKVFAAEAPPRKVALHRDVEGVVTDSAALAGTRSALKGVDAERVRGHPHPGRTAHVLGIAVAAGEFGVDLKTLEHAVHIGAVQAHSCGRAGPDPHPLDRLLRRWRAVGPCHRAEEGGIAVLVAVIRLGRVGLYTPDIDLRQFDVVIARDEQVDVDRLDPLAKGLQIDVENAVLLAVKGLRQIGPGVQTEKLSVGVFRAALGRFVGEFLVHGDRVFVLALGVDRVIRAEQLEVAVVEMADPEGELVAPVIDIRVKGRVIDVRVVRTSDGTSVDRLVVVAGAGKGLALARTEQILSVGLALGPVRIQADDKGLEFRL